ncbi:hypothetical protein Aduo_013710 [Ancylostoma duodenale]
MSAIFQVLTVTSLLCIGYSYCESCLGRETGWIPFDRTGFEYKYVGSLKEDEWIEWKKAEEICQKSGAHLVSIHSMEENAFVSGLIGKSYNYIIATWIGLEKDTVTKRLTWTDGSEVDFENVYEDGHSHHCDVVNGLIYTEHIDGTDDQRWALYGHDPKLEGYVCKRPRRPRIMEKTLKK